MADWTESCPHAARDYLDGRRQLDEVECIVADLAGIARGKAMPASKFARQTHFYLPNSIFLQTITGDWADDGDRRLHRARHGADAGLLHRHRGALDGRLHAADHPRQRTTSRATRSRSPRATCCAACVALYNAQGWQPDRRARDGVLPRRPQHRPEPADQPPMGRSGRRAAARQAYSMSRGRRIRPGHRRHLRFRRGAGLRDRRHPAGRRRRARSR